MEGVDPKFEFEAPMFVDFTVAQVEDDNADEYFDRHHSVLPSDLGETLNTSVAPPVNDFQQDHSTTTTTETISHSTNTTSQVKIYQDQPTQQETQETHEINVAVEETFSTSQETSDTILKKAKPGPTTQENVAPVAVERKKRIIQAKKPSFKRGLSRNKLRSRAKAPANINEKAVEKKDLTRGPTTRASIKRKADTEAGVQPKKLTAPKTPKMLKRAASRAGSVTKAAVKTTEERELEKIAELRKEMTLKRKRSRSSFKKLQNSTDYVPIRSNKPLTTPQGPEFETEKIMKKRPNSAQRGPAKRSPKKLEQDLRNYKPTGRSTTTSITRPNPFKFSKRSKTAAKAEAKPFVAMAQQIQKFSSKTPERFHKPKAGDSQPHLPAHTQPQLTRPVSPNFALTKRARPTNVKSTQQLEEEYIANVRKNPFKAQKLNTEILHSQGDYGVPRVQKKELTVPQDFNLQTEKRAAARPAVEVPAFQIPKFVAQPAPRSMLQPRASVRSVKSIKEQQPEEVAPKKFVAREMPEFDEIKFEPKLSHQATVPEPFAITPADPVATREELQKKQQKQLTRMRSFKARALPSDSPDQLPVVERKGPTVVQPFELPSHKIGEIRKNEFEKKKFVEEVEEQKKKHFLARKCSVTKLQPFVPLHSSKLTEVSEFRLNSQARAEDRAQFNSNMKMKTQREQQDAEAEAERQRMEEEKTIRKLRKQLVHKAQPVANARPMEVMPSLQRLTEPVTPQVAKRHLSSLRV